MSFKLAASQLLLWMFDNHPEELDVMPFYVHDSARPNKKRPAYVSLLVPDEWVKNLRGKPNFIDTYVSFRIPAELFNQWKVFHAGDAMRDAMAPSPSQEQASDQPCTDQPDSPSTPEVVEEPAIERDSGVAPR